MSDRLISKEKQQIEHHNFLLDLFEGILLWIIPKDSSVHINLICDRTCFHVSIFSGNFTRFQSRKLYISSCIPLYNFAQTVNSEK